MTAVVPCTKGGIPHLTADLVADILTLPEEKIVAVSVMDIIDVAKVHQGSSTLSFLDLAGLQGGFQTVLTTRNALLGPHATAPTTNIAIAGTSDNGRIQIGQEDWARAVALVRPTFACPLYDSPFAPNPPVSESTKSSAGGDANDTGLNDTALQPPTKKRRITSLGRSAKWHQSARGHLVNSACKLLIPLSITSERVLAKTPSQIELDERVAGFVVDAVNHFEPMGVRMERINDARTRLYKAAQPSVMIYCQAETLTAMLLSIIAGATHVEVGFPFSLAHKGIALNIAHREADSSSVAPITAASSKMVQLPVMQDMHDPSFRVDSSPLSTACRCYTCKRHSRAYVHHLLLVQEMNSEILLSLHNLTQVIDLMRTYRDRKAALGCDAAVSYLRRVLQSNF